MSLRRLNPTEEAFAIMNDASAMSAVIVLQVRSEQLQIARLRTAVARLTKRHPYLLYTLQKQSGKWYFRDTPPPGGIKIVEQGRSDEHSYFTTTETALNTRTDSEGALFRVMWVRSHDNTVSEIILAFHHSVVDSILLRVLLDDFLTILGDGRPGGGQLENPFLHHQAHNVNADLKKKLGFIVGQLRDEMNYRLKGIKQPGVTSSANAAYSMRFSKDDSDSIIAICRDNRVSLNCLINAAMLKATLKHKHPAVDNTLCRSMTFANMRSLLLSTSNRLSYGCFIAMLRFTLNVSHSDTAISLGKKLQEQMVTARRSDRMNMFFSTANSFARMALRLNPGRMGVSALSFIGPLELQKRYGNIELLDVQAYITNNRLGPEFTGFGKVLFGRIGLDFCTLSEETLPEQARAIIDDVRKYLQVTL